MIDICKHGHPLTADNLYTHPRTGKVQCQQCRKDYKDRSLLKRYERWLEHKREVMAHEEPQQ